MGRIDDILENPDLVAKILFWVGGLFAGLAILVQVVQDDRINLVYEIQAPFGLLFLVLIVVIYIVVVFVLTNLYGLLRYQEQLGYFTPVTRTVVLIILVALIMSTELIGPLVYSIIRVLSTGGGTP